jgi:hypothetical protein
VKLVASRHRRCEEETQDGCEPACSHGFKRGNRDDTRDTLGCDGDLGSTNAGALMQNRWLNLPSTPPFVAPCDLEIVTKRSGLLRGDCELKLDLLPQPWTGNVNTANVFRLALNPGFSATDYISATSRTRLRQAVAAGALLSDTRAALLPRPGVQTHERLCLVGAAAAGLDCRRDNRP